MEWTWIKANEKDLAQFATDEALQLFELNVSSFDLKREGQFECLLKAIHNTLVTQKIQYDLEKFSSVETHQRIRTPVEILSKPRQGTCLDLAILFCGLCLGCDLLPKLVVLEGHALAVVPLYLLRDKWSSNQYSQKEFLGKRVKDSQGNDRIEPDVFRNVDLLKELIDDGNYSVVECTGFAYSKSLNQISDKELAGFERSGDGYFTFEQAEEVGRRQLDRLPFKYAVDITVAHEAWGIERARFDIPATWQKPVINKMYAELSLETLNNSTALGNLNEAGGPVDMEAHISASNVNNSVVIGNQQKGNASSGNFKTTQKLDEVNHSSVMGEHHQSL